jgi:O-antigen/teichoic acid export membrane protein
VAMLVAWAAFAGSLSLDQILLAQTAATLIASLPLLAKLLGELGLPRLRLPLRQFLADARVGLPLTVELIIDFLLRSSDRYLILLFLSVADVGRYQPAYVIGSAAIFLVTMTESMLIPSLSRLVDLGQRAEAVALMTTVLRLFLMLATPIAVGALMTGPALVSLLANAEIGAASHWVTPFVAAAMIFYGVARLASTTAYVIGRTQTILMANAVGAVANVLLNLVFLPLVRDITVPAVTTLIGYVVGYIYIVWALRALWPVRIDWGAMLRYTVASAGMGVFLWCLGFRVAETSDIGTTTLGASIVAAIVVYFVLLRLIGGVDRREMQRLASLARRNIPDAGPAA